MPDSTSEPIAITEIVDVPYKAGEELSEYEQAACKLDLYLPEGLTGFPTMVWLHGGGLKEGDKHDDRPVMLSLAKAGMCVAAANYRMSPQANFPAYVEDAAVAYAWVRGHIAERGGDATRVFLGGHSAGGYLVLMAGLDGRYLAEHGIDFQTIAGLVPVSGQTMTHYTVREERGVGQFTIVADEAAPVHYCSAKTPPMLVLYADEDVPARPEENEYLVATMHAAGNDRVYGFRAMQRDHGTIASMMEEENDPIRAAIVEFVFPSY